MDCAVFLFLVVRRLVGLSRALRWQVGRNFKAEEAALLRGFTPDFHGVFEGVKSLQVNRDRFFKTCLSIRSIRLFHVFKARRKSSEAGYDASIKGFARLGIN